MTTWETASELDNRGFNLYRGTSPDGWDRQLNSTLIPSQSQGSPSGFVYTWEDRAGLLAGTTYYYWLQDVDTSGAMTLHGPVSVDFTAPTAVTLNGVQASPGLDTLRYSTHAAGAAALPWLWPARRWRWGGGGERSGKQKPRFLAEPGFLFVAASQRSAERPDRRTGPSSGCSWRMNVPRGKLVARRKSFHTALRSRLLHHP